MQSSSNIVTTNKPTPRFSQARLDALSVAQLTMSEQWRNSFVSGIKRQKEAQNSQFLRPHSRPFSTPIVISAYPAVWPQFSRVINNQLWSCSYSSMSTWHIMMWQRDITLQQSWHLYWKMKMINVIIITGAVQLHLKNERCACKKKLGIKNQQFLLVAVITAGVNFFTTRY